MSLQETIAAAEFADDVLRYLREQKQRTREETLRMSIVITGDTHGTFDIGKVVRYFNEHEDEYTRDDYLIICGDVGICGFSAAYEANTRAEVCR